VSRFFLGMTGASGQIYGERLLRSLVAAGHEVDLALSPAACKVLAHELDVTPEPDGMLRPQTLTDWLGESVASRVRSFASSAIEAPASSGTSGIQAVILCPCSMGTLARVVAGYSSNLVERAADVALKERRTLVLVPRETPLSEIHLENMLKLRRMGATLLPAMPGFYFHPQSIDELVDHIVGKVLDSVGVVEGDRKRWEGLPDLAQRGPEPPQDPGLGGR
jgi:4-hydroxy-3-polyprenylbenzoate decarboxylase